MKNYNTTLLMRSLKKDHNESYIHKYINIYMESLSAGQHKVHTHSCAKTGKVCTYVAKTLPTLQC